MYQVIDALGGPAAFYRRFFLTAASPLGFLRGQRNLNYYDDRRLARAVLPFIADSIRRHLAVGGRDDVAVVLGAAENARVLRALNAEHRFFERLVVLEHPRFIMQYRRPRLRAFVRKYVAALSAASRRRATTPAAAGWS
jgi:hypothetical protein